MKMRCQEIEYIQKDTDFCLSLKILVRIWVIRIVKNLLIVPRHLQKCNKNCLKESSSKTAEATGDLIGNKIADKIIKY